MEAPRFFNNKARAFSSLVLATGIAACGGNELEKGFHIPTPYTQLPTPQEQKPLTVTANVIEIDGSPILSNLTIDDNCGVILKPGDKTYISFTLTGYAFQPTADFELALTKDPSGRLIFASLPVDQGHSIAFADYNGKLLPLGVSTPLGGDRVLFAFFSQRNFKVKDCAVDNPALQ